MSTPLAWEELDAFHPDELTIPAVAKRVEGGADPWLEMNDRPQSLEPLLEMYAEDRGRTA